MRNNNVKRRVVVTGLGVVSSIGIGWQEFWKNLLAGKSGISEVDYVDSSKYDRKLVGQVRDFDFKIFCPKNNFKHFGRASQMLIVAGGLALKDSMLAKADLKETNAGLCVGTTMGEGQVIEKCVEIDTTIGCDTLEKILPLTYPANSISSNFAHVFDIKNNSHLFANACAAGNFAVGRATDMIRTGFTNCMFAGGVDPLSRIAFTGFHRLVAIDSQKCRPFDKNRQGMIPGEGAGILVLEELEHARKRGALIYAEILGCGAASDAFHLTQPQAKGGIKAIRKALNDAGLSPEDVDYINAHGTGTPENDKTECEVFKAVFGERLKNIPVSSIKSMLGHTMGAASALESIACCLAIKDQKIPPTINYETPDPECDIDCVPNTFRKHRVRVVLNNSLAFGGNNFSLVLKKWKE
ncbi:MAG TPA: beta-ketoacyl-[acyl-carrier-protein] synthase family protein [Candidatus Omnitrophota bacterium]|nr:beta-ketoacyl-[acyl-carrier-protein] synthase family protein [Candidatus Omnitrophota bacterium]HSA31428.1 beta-ketoacyl-[acyl-carrier-protein] synthase family protein [Candidatus Omnitrophota bacterium]